MHIPEKKLISRIESEIKKQLLFLRRWKITRPGKKRADSADILITAYYKREAYRFCVEVKRAGYPSYIRQAAASVKELAGRSPGYYPVIAVPVIGRQARHICDQNGIGYIDLAGSVKIVTGGIVVQKEAAGGKPKQEREGQSIFSPKAARIAKLFLLKPRARWTQKEIAARTGVSKGMVSRIVGRMADMGYIVEKGNLLTLSGFEDLLMAWADEALRRRENKKNYYVWARNPKELMSRVSASLSDRKVKYAFTQEAGASLVAPFSTFEIVSLYAESFDVFPAGFLGAEEVDKGFNLTLFEAADDGIFTNARKVDGMKVVDDVQLYIDLKKNPLRGDKQAGHVLNIIRKNA